MMTSVMFQETSWSYQCQTTGLPWALPAKAATPPEERTRHRTQWLQHLVNQHHGDIEALEQTHDCSIHASNTGLFHQYSLWTPTHSTHYSCQTSVELPSSSREHTASQSTSLWHPTTVWKCLNGNIFIWQFTPNNFYIWYMNENWVMFH